MNGFPEGEGPENTRQMDLRPDNVEDLAQLEPGEFSVGLWIAIEGDLFRQVVDYPVIVEAWRRKDGGRVKREWFAQFTQAERNLISRYHAKFYRWYLVTGTPRKIVFRKIRTLQVLQKAVNFFATV